MFMLIKQLILKQILMKTILKSIFAIVILSIIITSCSDDDSNNASSTNPAGDSFTWTENGGSTIVADSAFYESQYKTIKAYKGQNMEHFIEINLTDDAVANYPIGNGYAVSKLKSTGIYAATAGSINITAKSATSMSGAITSTGSGAGITSLSAEFTGIEVR